MEMPEWFSKILNITPHYKTVKMNGIKSPFWGDFNEMERTGHASSHRQDGATQRPIKKAA
jgi:hypothetical protein